MSWSRHRSWEQVLKCRELEEVILFLDGFGDAPANRAGITRLRRDDEGYYHLVDRKHNMIISGGENIYPSEVENLLGAHPAIKDVAVIGRPHPTWGEAVHAVIVLRDGATATERDILGWCNGRIAGYKKPRSASFVADDEMPRTATGKILHRMLRERRWNQVCECWCTFTVRTQPAE